MKQIYDWDKLDRDSVLFITCTKASEVLKVRTAAISWATRNDKKVSIRQVKEDGSITGAIVKYV